MIVGLDIGGANLKVATIEGSCASLAFALWERSGELRPAISRLLADRNPTLVALTMSGELADCYADRGEGVAAIVDAVTAAVDCPVVVWQTAGEFVSPEVAVAFPMLTAAANWHALATFATRAVSSGGLLFDVGTTTCDVVALRGGAVLAGGLTDAERLLSGELVYTGVGRTPVASVAADLVVAVERSPIGRAGVLRPAAESFADTGDVWRVALGDETIAGGCPTADRRGTTLQESARRLRRQYLIDEEGWAGITAKSIADACVASQIECVAESVDRVVQSVRPETVVVSGSGRCLADEVLDRCLPDTPRVDLADVLSADASDAACAFAVASLATERVLTRG